MLIGIPFAAVVFLAGHWVVAATFRRSLLRSPYVWTARWPNKLAVWIAGPALCYLLTAVSAFPYLRAQGPPSLTVEVVSGAPANRAGIVDGDRMIAIDGRQLAHWEDVRPKVQSAYDRPLDVELERAGRKLHVSVTPVEGKIGVTPRPGLIPLNRAVVDALTFPVRAVTAAASGFWHAIRGDESVEVTGPVGVVRATGASASSLLFLFALTLSMALPIVFVVDGVSFLVLSLVMRDRW